MAIDIERPDAELFRPVERGVQDAEALGRPAIGYWRDAWRRFKQNKMAVVGLIVVAVMLLLSFVGPVISGKDPRVQNYLAVNQLPSAEYWFGTDQLGRDVFTRLWYGTQISLAVGILAALIDIFIGVLYGGISGYLGGRVDDVMMRIVDILYGIPTLIIVILLLVVMEPGFLPIAFALGIAGWAGMARLVRGQVLQLKNQEFVLAAQTLGQSTMKIILRHLIPNSLSIILVTITFTIPTAIFSEAFLSFIGLGIPPPLASLGTMIDDGYNLMRAYPYQLIFPGIAISMVMLGFNFLGDGLRDALDPRMRK